MHSTTPQHGRTLRLALSSRSPLLPTMIIVLAILAATRASPIGKPSPLLSLDQLSAPSCDDPKACRSLWDIIRSCAITILLCTWVSVHPNIPSPQERWPRVTVRRIGLMLAALFVPEIMIAWALRQRQAAVALAEKHKDDGWTTTHGFFAIMGGFMEYEGNRAVRVLLPEQLKSYSLTGNGDFPRIAKEEIEDRSKGDVISKTVVILQTGWFVMQCIARGVRHLPITELELVTVAFAALNFVMYLLWWDKPLNVQRGVRVYKKRDTEQAIDDGDVEDTSSVGFWGTLGDSLLEFPATIVRGPLTTHASFVYRRRPESTEEPVDDGLVEAPSSVGFWGALCHSLSELPAAIVRGPLTANVHLHHTPWLWRVLSWPILKPSSILMGEDGHPEYENLKRINTFYPNSWPAGRAHAFAMFIVIAVASVFGGIHCIGWSFTFPSSIEQTLWRFSSVFIAVIPILMIPVTYALDGVEFAAGPWCYLWPIINWIFLTLPNVYMLGRLVLLVLPFLTLRSLPPAAYSAVHWTSFIPHI
ncbi:hypothetical protein F5148DRAFT_1019947 [Russula earlei]|uniref:Uncharacterized protein n=1 Tax=Russula earlei TaxID=71964 RepID=A0ACC0TUK3_9AGAM|nr:hypothetical protein F5148DRAFT_1019947 [Russula earlei]